MADALVSIALDQLVSVVRQEVEQEVWLVLGVKNERKKMETTFRAIQAVLEDAEEKQVHNKAVKFWLEELKDVAYDMDDVLDEWKLIIREDKVRTDSFSCYLFLKSIIVRWKFAREIREIRERLDVIANEKNKFSFNLGRRNNEDQQREMTSSIIDVSEICGRAVDTDIVINKLMGAASEREMRRCPSPIIISIVGIGGLGKTTLAQLVFNDDTVKEAFEMRIWVCVSDPFDRTRVAKAIIEETGETVPDAFEWQALHRCLSNSIKGKRFLLVLDDVWTEHHSVWHPLKVSLKGGAQGSRILVTTRNEKVALMMEASYIHRLRHLSGKECWSLFSSLAFAGKTVSERQKLEEIGKKISDKCKGVPLTAKTLGSLMRFKVRKQDWQNVLQSKTRVEDGVSPALLLSYSDLPSHLKQCFGYCAVYPKDHQIWKEKLIQLWMAQGFLKTTDKCELEVIGEEYFDDLLMRSFFQDLTRNVFSIMTSCKIHDLVHDFANFITNNECLSVIIDRFTQLNCRNARHVSVVCHDKDRVSFSRSISKAKSLRTLILEWPSLVEVPPESFNLLQHLRALDMSGSSLKRLPSEVEKLIHLRFLDLSKTKLRELPEAICNLYYLQTLKLEGCARLKKLPISIGKLANLRHLEIEDTNRLSPFPQGFGRLNSLRTLRKFIVSDGIEGCKINDLEDLNQLRGYLEISGLKRVRTGRDARDALLKRKQFLCSLRFLFSGTPFSSFGEQIEMQIVLEGLQPHSNLEKLVIESYSGIKLPSWMESRSIKSKLSCLEKLEIRDCPHLTARDHQAFPDTLKALHVYECPQLDWTSLCLPPLLEELVLIGNAGVLSRSVKPICCHHRNHNKLKRLAIVNSQHSLLPRGFGQLTTLQRLDIIDCANISCMSDEIEHLTSLQKLNIRGCPILAKHCRLAVGKEWMIISHIPNIFIDDEQMW